MSCKLLFGNKYIYITIAISLDADQHFHGKITQDKSDMFHLHFIHNAVAIAIVVTELNCVLYLEHEQITHKCI